MGSIDANIQGLILCSSNNEHYKHAVPHVSLVDTCVTVMKVSISKLSELFISGHSRRHWARKSLKGDCYVRQLRCVADNDIVWHLLWLWTWSDGLQMKRE
jgi:hypothetical protein